MTMDIPESTLGVGFSLLAAVCGGIWHASGTYSRFRTGEEKAREERMRVDRLEKRVDDHEERMSRTMNSALAELNKSMGDLREMVAGLKATITLLIQRNGN